VLIAVLPVGYVIGSFIAARFSVRHGAVRLTFVGSLLVMVSTAGFLGLALGGVRGTMELLAPLLVMGVFHGLTSPSALAGVVNARPELAGTAAALAGFIQTGFAALVSLFMGLLSYEDQLPTATVMMALALVGLTAAWGVTRAARR